MEYEGNHLRHELKYYISTKTYHILRERMRHILTLDSNTKNEDGYLIGSLYFDDMYSSAYNDKISGGRFRKKFRIRAYERSDAVINLECKEKYDSFISKHSAKLSKEEYHSILAGDYDFLKERSEPVCRQLLAYNRIALLRPTTVVEYTREAYVSEIGNVRITFDKELQANLNSIDLFDQRLILTPVLPRGMVVLEVKYDDFLPPYIQKSIFEQEMQKCAISKFVMCKNRNWRALHHD
ncbi:MAG: polyphosphate polymerase domain-containing protein [Angelakisella sp.]